MVSAVMSKAVFGPSVLVRPTKQVHSCHTKCLPKTCMQTLPSKSHLGSPCLPRLSSRAKDTWALRYKKAEVDDLHDWRIKQMCSIAEKYYSLLWSAGDLEAADDILDDDVQLKDELWASHPFVGRTALKKQIAKFRTHYPDLKVEIQDIGVYGTQDLAVRWTATATNLGGPHATHHYTHFGGVSSLHFTEDRKRIAEVVAYRQPTAEEMTNKCELSWNREASTTEIQLVPLHVSTANYDYLPEFKKGE